jgi:chromosome partitioning protein
VNRRRTHVLFVGSQKGGVAKTTNCVHIAAALAEAGRRCLIWDLDANGGATSHFGVDGNEYAGSLEVITHAETPRDVILSADDGVADLPPNLDLLPAGGSLESLAFSPGTAPKTLNGPLDDLAGVYDYVLLDTAPNLTPPTVAAYRSAEAFLFVTLPDPFAVVGLRNAVTNLNAAIAGGNRAARLLGVVLSRVTRGKSGSGTKLERQLATYIGDHLKSDGKSLRFKTTIPQTNAIPKCQMAGHTLFQSNPKHRACKAYRRLTREIEQRLSE